MAGSSSDSSDQRRQARSNEVDEGEAPLDVTQPDSVGERVAPDCHDIRSGIRGLARDAIAFCIHPIRLTLLRPVRDGIDVATAKPAEIPAEQSRLDLRNGRNCDHRRHGGCRFGRDADGSAVVVVVVAVVDGIVVAGAATVVVESVTPSLLMDPATSNPAAVNGTTRIERDTGDFLKQGIPPHPPEHPPTPGTILYPTSCNHTDGIG